MLALGGGLRGILTLGILQKMEDILRERHGNSDDFRLCHYFDLIAGTSTGAIIAATLTKGWAVEELRKKYMKLGERVFEKSLFRKGFFRAKYHEEKLVKELKEVYMAPAPPWAARSCKRASS
jgi:patatin-like phospholipase/acyl hydrolase